MQSCSVRISNKIKSFLEALLHWRHGGVKSMYWRLVVQTWSVHVALFPQNRNFVLNCFSTQVDKWASQTVINCFPIQGKKRYSQVAMCNGNWLSITCGDSLLPKCNFILLHNIVILSQHVIRSCSVCSGQAWFKLDTTNCCHIMYI